MGKKDAALQSVPAAQERKVKGDSEHHQALAHAHKDYKQRTVSRKQAHLEHSPSKSVKPGEVAYPFGLGGKIFAFVTFVLFVASCIYWIVQLALPKN